MDAQIIRGKTLRKFNRDAATYEQTSDGRFCARVYPEIVREIGAAPCRSLLDVGCGTGAILSSVPMEIRRCGLDLSEKMIGRAKETLGGAAELKVGDAEALPWRGDEFDAVCCTFSFHHYPHPDRVLAEIGRVLRPGGRLILADPWLPWPLLPLLNVMLRYCDGGDCREYSKGGMKKLLSAAGLSLRSFRHPTDDTFLLTALKPLEGGAR